MSPSSGWRGQSHGWSHSFHTVPMCGACGLSEELSDYLSDSLSDRLSSSLSSVLESEPGFGLEEAKQHLEGISLLLSNPLYRSLSCSCVVYGL